VITLSQITRVANKTADLAYANLCHDRSSNGLKECKNENLVEGCCEDNLKGGAWRLSHKIDTSSDPDYDKGHSYFVLP